MAQYVHLVDKLMFESLHSGPPENVSNSQPCDFTSTARPYGTKREIIASHFPVSATILDFCGQNQWLEKSDDALGPNTNSPANNFRKLLGTHRNGRVATQFEEHYATSAKA